MKRLLMLCLVLVLAMLANAPAAEAGFCYDTTDWECQQQCQWNCQQNYSTVHWFLYCYGVCRDTICPQCVPS